MFATTTSVRNFRKYTSTPYSNRRERNQFVAQELSDYIGQTVLNIGGGGQKYLKEFIDPSIQYYELDIAGDPDLKIDLEKQLPIPAEDNSYETVICTDVLEHLDNFHDVFDELIRISSKWIILSLPNAARDALAYYRNQIYLQDNSLERKMNYGKHMKYYGLPFNKPLDRHKWFFSYTEAEEFIQQKAQEKNLTIQEMFGIGYNKKGLMPTLKRELTQLIKGEDVRKNAFNFCIWTVLEKGGRR